MNGLNIRLMFAESWRVALKIMAIIHRMVSAEGDHYPPIDLQYQFHINPLVKMSQFQDPFSPRFRECVMWVRTYSCYLKQRLLCNVYFRYDIVTENQNAQKIEDLGMENVLKYLPPLQQLLGCLIDCTPQGSHVALNSLIQYALNLLVNDCPNICAAINTCMESSWIRSSACPEKML